MPERNVFLRIQKLPPFPNFGKDGAPRNSMAVAALAQRLATAWPRLRTVSLGGEVAINDDPTRRVDCKPFWARPKYTLHRILFIRNGAG